MWGGRFTSSSKSNCCAFGHRKIYFNIESELYAIIESLINEYGVETFLTGGMGETDEKFSSVVRSLKGTSEYKISLSNSILFRCFKC